MARKAVIIDYPSLRSLNVLAPLLFGLKRQLEGNTRHYLSFSRDQLAHVLQGSGFTRLAEEKQLFLPTVVHRKLGSGAALHGVEKLCRAAGITRLFGSPVILRAETVEGGKR